MTTTWEQATAAAQQHDWPTLNRYLEQVLDQQADRSETTQADDQTRSLALVVEVLQTADFQTQWDIAKLVPHFRQAAIAPLVKLLQDDTAELESRWFAARILGEMTDPSAIAALVETLQTTEDEDLSTVAAEALANLGATAIAALTELLQDPTTRALAVQALAQIRRADTIAPLLTVVDDQESQIRALAIEALSSFHDPRVPPVLLRALSDPAAIVRRVAVSGLGVRKDLAEELPLVSCLSDRLWDLNLSVCEQAAIALGRIGSDAAAATLLRGLRSPNTPLPLQLKIVQALAWIERAIALESLQQGLAFMAQAGNATVYREIVVVLGRWTTANLKPKVAEILIQELRARPLAADDIAQAIALSLGQLEHRDAIAPLIELLAADPRTRLHAIAALKTLDAERAHQELTQLAQQKLAEPLQQGIAIALAEWGQA